jgi:hypothetical protein
MRPPAAPLRGLAFVGAAAASFATGPTLVLLLSLHELFRPSSTFDDWRLGGWVSMAAYSSIFCLIGSIPAAALNAFMLSRFARRGADEAVVAAISGGTIGFLVALLFMGFSGGWVDGIFLLWFSTTGSLMGLLHWLIAIRPHRRWRLALVNDEEAIRAME